MTLQRRIRQLHKILAVIVFIQLFMWMLSGLYMTAVPIDKVRGQHLVSSQSSGSLQTQVYFPIGELFLRYSDIQKIELTSRLHRPVYRIVTGEKSLLIDALTAQPLSVINEKQASELAVQAYQGEGSLAAAKLISNISQAPEVRGRELPVWQISFDDFWSTSIYVSASEATIVAVRSDLWRWFDFLWMLHIMDYEERENFNNPLVILMSSLGLFLVTSGILMMINGISKKGIRSIWT